jgi:hypothetical protein
LGGNDVSTKHYALTSETRPPLNIWFAVDENDIPYIFELQIANSNGLFTIKHKM